MPPTLLPKSYRASYFSPCSQCHRCHQVNVWKLSVVWKVESRGSGWDEGEREGRRKISSVGERVNSRFYWSWCNLKHRQVRAAPGEGLVTKEQRARTTLVLFFASILGLWGLEVKQKATRKKKFDHGRGTEFHFEPWIWELGRIPK